MATSPPRLETRYTASPDGYVAYQVFGTGPPDVVFMTNWATNMDAMWDEPSVCRSRPGRPHCRARNVGR
jgi:hypothetical protein